MEKVSIVVRSGCRNSSFPQIWKRVSKKSFSGYVSDKGRPERIGSKQLRPVGSQCIYSVGITFAQYWFWNFSCSFAAISDRLPCWFQANRMIVRIVYYRLCKGCFLFLHVWHRSDYGNLCGFLSPYVAGRLVYQHRMHCIFCPEIAEIKQMLYGIEREPDRSALGLNCGLSDADRCMW